MIEVLGSLNPERHSQMDIMGWNGIMSTIDRMHEPKKIAVPVVNATAKGYDLCRIGGGGFSQPDRPRQHNEKGESG